MQQFNYPTVILYGEDALSESCKRMKGLGFNKPLLVTDATLVKIGLIENVLAELKKENIEAIVFDGTHPNPIEDDCVNGAVVYRKNQYSRNG